jgi:hypothetical protein
MSKGEKVVARLPHGYNMVFRDRGEVYQLVEGRNDETLRRNRYFTPFADNKDNKEISCDKGCGRFFCDMVHLEMHYRKRSCNDDSASPTKVETAELIGVDVDKLTRVFSGVEGEVSQAAKDLDNAI